MGQYSELRVFLTAISFSVLFFTVWKAITTTPSLQSRFTICTGVRKSEKYFTFSLVRARKSLVSIGKNYRYFQQMKQKKVWTHNSRYLALEITSPSLRILSIIFRAMSSPNSRRFTKVAAWKDQSGLLAGIGGDELSEPYPSSQSVIRGKSLVPPSSAVVSTVVTSG